mgnify:FL=1
MNFWNGNKSPIRQHYELDILHCLLTATEKEFGPFTLHNDVTDYPLAKDEGNVFNTGTDILVTVAGNTKFAQHHKIIIPQAIAKGLLGYRLLIIKQDKRDKFKQINTAKQMQQLTAGIPATWADADLFRANNYTVCEKGVFGEVFQRLKNNECDYVALGANEIEEAFTTMAEPLGDLVIEPTLMLYYPFPLVFYLNPKQVELAARVKVGLQYIINNGQLDAIFNKYNGNIVERLSLKQRKALHLNNPILPDEMRDFSPSLLGNS